MAKGVKTGGRTKGTPNKRTLANQGLMARATSPEMTPLAVMLKAMKLAWDQKDYAAAANFAKDAAPYLHPRLANVQHSGDADNPLAFEVVSGVTRISDMMDDADTDGAEQTTH